MIRFAGDIWQCLKTFWSHPELAGSATGAYCVEVRNTVKYDDLHRTAPHNNKMIQYKMSVVLMKRNSALILKTALCPAFYSSSTFTWEICSCGFTTAYILKTVKFTISVLTSVLYFDSKCPINTFNWIYHKLN